LYLRDFYSLKLKKNKLNWFKWKLFKYKTIFVILTQTIFKVYNIIAESS